MERPVSRQRSRQPSRVPPLAFRVEITLLEKSREHEAGGNTPWSPFYMRLEAPDRLGGGFEDDMFEASGGLADRSYFRTLAEDAGRAIGWLGTAGGGFLN